MKNIRDLIIHWYHTFSTYVISEKLSSRMASFIGILIEFTLSR